jgi:hypothetical protein
VKEGKRNGKAESEIKKGKRRSVKRREIKGEILMKKQASSIS